MLDYQFLEERDLFLLSPVESFIEPWSWKVFVVVSFSDGPEDPHILVAMPTCSLFPYWRELAYATKRILKKLWFVTFETWSWKAVWLCLAFSCKIIHSKRSLLPCHKNTQAALWLNSKVTCLRNGSSSSSQGLDDCSPSWPPDCNIMREPES